MCKLYGGCVLTSWIECVCLRLFLAQHEGVFNITLKAAEFVRISPVEGAACIALRTDSAFLPGRLGG